MKFVNRITFIHLCIFLLITLFLWYMYKMNGVIGHPATDFFEFNK